MIFKPTPLSGVFVVEPELRQDERGFFARSFCVDEFKRIGLNPQLSQCSISFNHRAGTLRGLHYQAAPHPECKLVRCTMGAIYDVALDLRPDSATQGSWFGIELSSENRSMLYIPEGVAHGFQTLADCSEVFYQINVPQEASAARGLRWNDPAFKIAWPHEVTVISDRDRDYPDYKA